MPGSSQNENAKMAATRLPRGPRLGGGTGREASALGVPRQWVTAIKLRKNSSFRHGPPEPRLQGWRGFGGVPAIWIPAVHAGMTA